ncbi:conserved hypothetical protein [Deferribacter desulfuricans SSM1]|uniref:DUF302 domain-containing protein n=1 Tax=Deferribacter desulfuricans (strain DSM 14783 / JCM 11476 / NBRC 101012 / SSM1) TaxID=639282 RepID=D3PB38_DEFDS|nr:DUF302 domain-containing protein [Deferribacter desulfuricans]BAI79811.1 conserved hypothetical protein [Deferribacter desulfuricans SSM1]
MNYYLSKKVSYSFDETVLKTKELLKVVGFGVLYELDMKSLLKEKIDVDIEKYFILGACNPHFGYKALQTEPNIGTVIPCNVVIRKISDNETEVSTINPVKQMSIVENTDLEEIANEIFSRLSNVISRL